MGQQHSRNLGTGARPCCSPACRHQTLCGSILLPRTRRRSQSLQHLFPRGAAVPAWAETLDSPPCAAPGGGISEPMYSVTGGRRSRIHPLPNNGERSALLLPPRPLPAGNTPRRLVQDPMKRGRRRRRTSMANCTCESAARVDGSLATAGPAHGDDFGRQHVSCPPTRTAGSVPYGKKPGEKEQRT
jgi:hypothetical protein